MGNTAKESKPQRQRVNKKILAQFRNCYNFITASRFSDKVAVIAYRTLCQTFTKPDMNEWLENVYNRLIEIKGNEIEFLKKLEAN
jgi:hypothetical protein